MTAALQLHHKWELDHVGSCIGYQRSNHSIIVRKVHLIASWFSETRVLCRTNPAPRKTWVHVNVLNSF